MAYTFISNDNEIKQMIFGDASEALERKYKYKGKCDISNYWLCKLNKVVFNGVVFNLQRSYVTFQLNFEGIRIPEHFYNYCVNNAFLEEKDRREGYNDLFKCDKLESLPDFQSDMFSCFDRSDLKEHTFLHPTRYAYVHQQESIDIRRLLPETRIRTFRFVWSRHIFALLFHTHFYLSQAQSMGEHPQQIVWPLYGLPLLVL